MPCGGNNNLIPNNERTQEEVRRNARKGGIKSGIVRKEKKLLRETFDELLRCPVSEKKVIAELKRIGIDDKQMSQQTALALGVIKRARTGDSFAATFIRDTIGQKEADKLDIIQPVQIVVKDDYGDGEKTDVK